MGFVLEFLRPSNRRKRGRRRKVFILVTAALTVFSVYVAFLTLSPTRANTFLRAQGFPATLQELEASYEEPSPGQNAAEIYAKAFAWFDNRSIAQKDAYAQMDARVQAAEDAEQRFPEDLVIAMRQFVADHAEVYALLHEAALRPACRFDVTISAWEDPPLDLISKLRECYRYLWVRLAVEAHEADGSQFLATLADAFALSGRMRRVPSALVYMNSSSFESTWIVAVVSALENDLLSGKELALLSAIIPGTPADRETQMVYVAEYLRMEQSYVVLSPDVLSHVKSWQDVRDVLARGFGLDNTLREERQVLHQEMPGLILRSGQEPYQWAGENVGNISYASTVTGTLVSAYYNMIRSRTPSDTYLASVAVALMRYRADHGELPGSLLALVPCYLSDPSRDPHTGDLLRYQVEEHGFAVYSVGPDLEDNGGKREGRPGKDGDRILRVHFR